VKYEILQGDCREMMRTMPEKSVQTCVTSPPYFGLRDYGNDGQIGLEPTPDEFVGKLVEVFREVRRVLRDDGTLWLNLGDSYASMNRSGRKESPGVGAKQEIKPIQTSVKWNAGDGSKFQWRIPAFDTEIKPKDLMGIPWRVAFALQADGWYLRQDIIWHKPNPMPESVTDRCTKAHEYIFLLSKSEKYFFDNEAIKEDAKSKSEGIRFGGDKYGDSDDPKHATKSGNVSSEYTKANKRSVWTVTTKPFSGAHFATFPPDLIEPCILAGSALGDTVLDPFGGSGTTAMVANQLGRNAVLCELNPEYIAIAHERIKHATAQQDLFFEEASA
jgi:site-specific DNA-methyltransferase (adenine-specific)